MSRVYSVEGALIMQNKRVKCSSESTNSEDNCNATHILRSFEVYYQENHVFIISGRNYTLLTDVGIDADGWVMYMTHEPHMLGRSRMLKTYYKAYCPIHSINLIPTIRGRREERLRTADEACNALAEERRRAIPPVEPIEATNAHNIAFDSTFDLNDLTNAFDRFTRSVPPIVVDNSSNITLPPLSASARLTLEEMARNREQLSGLNTRVDDVLSATAIDYQAEMRRVLEQGAERARRTAEEAERRTREASDRFVTNNPTPETDSIWSHHNKDGRL